jgi:glycine cleavage system transcriptional repressor
MKNLTVLTAVGRDRVGLVEQLSAEILRRGCNIEESRMAVLGGEFALIVLLSGERDSIDGLVADRQELLESLDLEITMRPTKPHHPVKLGRPYRIESVSLDSPGIVHAVTAVLRERNIGIDTLETETRGAPFTGAPMFHATIGVIVPPEVSITALRNELSVVAEQYDLDISIRPIVPSVEE